MVWCLGKKHSKKSILKMIKSRKNRPSFYPSAESRKKMSISHIGLHYLGKGKDNHCWKGGRISDGSKGYIYIYSPDHPFKTKKGYVYEHRLALEKKLGRYLKRDEVAHHINGIITDNRPENLEMMTVSEHTSYHRKCQKQRL